MANALLVIGNYNYSSWSLRAWLALRKAGADFDVKRLALDTAEFQETIAQHSPTGRVPVLHHAERVVWESLAIAEYANEAFAAGQLWPEDKGTRAEARAASAEMHSGFAALRAEMPMNCRAMGRRVLNTPALAADIDRVTTLWQDCRERYGHDGPWLFGRFSVADAMFAPVVSRFHTYGIAPAGAVAPYVETVLGDPDMNVWLEAARAEIEVIEREETGRQD